MLLKEFSFDFIYMQDSLFLDFVFLRNISFFYVYYFFFFIKLNIYFEFKNIKNMTYFFIYKLFFLFWYMFSLTPKCYGSHRLFHVGIHIYSFFFGVFLTKNKSLFCLFLLFFSIFPNIGEYGWRFWVLSIKNTQVIFSILTLEIFGELTGHSGFYNMPGDLFFKIELMGFPVKNLKSYLQCFKLPIIFSL